MKGFKLRRIRRLFVESWLVAATCVTAECFAGGSETYVDLSTGSDSKCTYAFSSLTPLARGDTCRVTVNFNYSGGYSERARGVTYWLESKPPGTPNSKYRKFTRTHVFNTLGKPETLKIRVSSSIQIRAVFNVGGDPNFGEYFTSTFQIRSRDWRICRLTTKDDCTDYDDYYEFYLTDPVLYVSAK